MTTRVAAIDDDSGFVRVLSRRIAERGWELHEATTAIAPRELVERKTSLLLVNPATLGAGFWEYLERVSEMLPDLGLIVCAEGAGLQERVRGLRAGADDWVRRPCHPEEAAARIEAVLRRRRRSVPRGEAATLLAGELQIRSDLFQAFVGDESLELTRREFELLQLLAAEPGRALEREAIYQSVWGYAMAHGDRSVDVFVRKLRQKLERRSPGWRYIHTHFGVGYRFDPEPVPDVQKRFTGSSQPFHTAARAE